MKAQPYSPEILDLAEKLIAGTITPEEQKRLFEWYDQFDDTQLILDSDQAEQFNRLNQDMLRSIRQKIRPPSKLRRLTRASLAAAALLLLAIGGWYFGAHGKASANLALTTSPKTLKPAGDIGPGSNKATLTLADGSTVTLDNAGTGSLGRQGNASVTKNTNGQLQYASTGDAPEKAMVYNILSTPRGGQYRLKLQDGTNVWLNASSSIRYPTAFLGKERKVEITGEAYFEVAKNAAMPFRVSISDGERPTEVEVLGTEFNVNAYKDESEEKTTLVEGAVKVIRGASAATLKPSQQAVVSGGAGIKTVEPGNIEQIIAWKEGAFEFDDADVPTIMRQISRWYDVDVEYDGKIPVDHFTGRFMRSTSLAGLLQILHISGVQLVAENKKIVIKA